MVPTATAARFERLFESYYGSANASGAMIGGMLEAYFGPAEEASALIVGSPRAEGGVSIDGGSADCGLKSRSGAMIGGMLEAYFGPAEEASALIVGSPRGEGGECVEGGSAEGEGGVCLLLDHLGAHDVLQHVLGFCAPRDLVSVAQVCTELRAAADDCVLWRRLWAARYGALSDAVFDGGGGAPAGGEGWKRHYFRFGATWMARAWEERGRCLIKIDGAWYDVTSFMAEHPGEPGLLEAAAGTDATEAFDYVGHSDHARRMLVDYASPLLNLPPEGCLRSALAERRRAAPTAAPAASWRKSQCIELLEQAGDLAAAAAARSQIAREMEAPTASVPSFSWPYRDVTRFFLRS